MKEINERLVDIKARIREKKRLNSTLLKVMEQKNKVEENNRKLYEQLKKEKIDVEKLEGLTLSSFLNSIVGKKEEKLEKEKKEYISAKISFDTAAAELESLKREIERIEVRIADMGDVDREYAQLIKGKENILIDHSIDFKDKLNNILEKESQSISENKEISEAIQAGAELVSALDKVQERLRSAGDWGAWDILGGGLITTMVKHSRIDDAQSEINNVQLLLERFHEELKDIGGEIDLSIEIGSFLTFADYFFDGLFVDLAVQSKIRDAQQKVIEAKQSVETVLKNLSERLSKNQKALIELRNERIKYR